MLAQVKWCHHGDMSLNVTFESSLSTTSFSSGMIFFFVKSDVALSSESETVPLLIDRVSSPPSINVSFLALMLSF